ncbi:MAG: hypothetical protein QXJ07_03405 [Candidatus Bathyarchaeia archaeon]
MNMLHIDWGVLEKTISSHVKGAIVLLCLQPSTAYALGKFLKAKGIVKDAAVVRQYVIALKKARILISVKKEGRGRIIVKTDVEGVYGCFADRLGLSFKDKKLLTETVSVVGSDFAKWFEEALKDAYLVAAKLKDKRYKCTLPFLPLNFDLMVYLALPLAFAASMSPQLEGALEGYVEHDSFKQWKGVLRFRISPKTAEWLTASGNEIVSLTKKVLSKILSEKIGILSFIMQF